MSFRLVNGYYRPAEGHTCRRCGNADPEMVRCYPNSFPQCIRCNAKLLYLGRVPSAECVTPNGRIDGHMKYVNVKWSKTGKPSGLLCAYCGKER
jgi:hypothetical protein